jgi:hypothetical protein
MRSFSNSICHSSEGWNPGGEVTTDFSGKAWSNINKQPHCSLVYSLENGICLAMGN